MTQANDLLTLTESQMEVAFFIDEDIEESSSDVISDMAIPETKKTRKITASRRRDSSKKKPYTEDSIRVYLQEIGRIRLLRAEEEIELARKIADLLQLERIREALWEELDQEPNDDQWGQRIFQWEQIEQMLCSQKNIQPKLSDVVAQLNKA